MSKACWLTTLSYLDVYDIMANVYRVSRQLQSHVMEPYLWRHFPRLSVSVTEAGCLSYLVPDAEYTALDVRFEARDDQPAGIATLAKVLSKSRDSLRELRLTAAHGARVLTDELVEVVGRCNQLRTLYVVDDGDDSFGEWIPKHLSLRFPCSLRYVLLKVTPTPSVMSSLEKLNALVWSRVQRFSDRYSMIGYSVVAAAAQSTCHVADCGRLLNTACSQCQKSSCDGHRSKIRCAICGQVVCSSCEKCTRCWSKCYGFRCEAVRNLPTCRGCLQPHCPNCSRPIPHSKNTVVCNVPSCNAPVAVTP